MISDFVNYDKGTGFITWIKSPSGRVKVGDQAGCLNRKGGYLRTRIAGRYYLNHHIAMILNGVSFEFVDHINGNRIDNRWENLRPCTHTENMRNRRVNRNSLTGVPGVTIHPSGKYHSYVRVDGERINLGYFADKWEAICTRMSANVKYGFHRNHGR